MSKSKKVLLIGWDAADWKVVHKLMDEGKMPTVQRLVDNGTIGNMATLHPPLSPMLWTSIATGKRPYKHGIYGFTEPTPDKMSVQPMTNVSRRSKALWNILNQNDMKSLIVGWWPSHPAEPINGVMVSDFFCKVPRKPGDPFKLMSNSIHPESLTEVLNKMRVHPSQLAPQHVLPFVPNAAKINQDQDSRLSGLMRTICECVSLHRAGTTLLQTQEWDFAAIYYDAIDHFCHGYMRFHPPQQSHITDEDFEIYSNVVTYAYIYHDMMLAKVLEAAGEDVTVILMSDHGFHPDHLRPKSIPSEPAGPAIEHRNLGIFIASGDGIKKDHVINGANLLDVAPTVLTMFGLPFGEDMDGRPLLDIFEDEIQPETIPSWEDVEGDDGQHSGDRQLDPAQSKETMEQLIALGYIDRPDKDSTVAVANCERELDYNLARAFMDGDRYGDAIPLLVKLYNENPIEFRFGLQLANCFQAMDRTADLETLVADLNERWRIAQGVAKTKLRHIAKITKERRIQFRELKKMDEENEESGKDLPKLAQYDMRGRPLLYSPAEATALRKIRAVAKGNPQVLDFLSATIAASKGEFENAIEFMEKAEASKSENPMYHVQLGNFYLGLERPDDALRAFGRVLEIDDLNPSALLGLCRSNILLGKPKKAAEYGQQAIGLKYHFPVGHFYLGEAQAMLKQFDAAIGSFETALAQNPNFIEAHHRLAELYRTKANQPQIADEHVYAAKQLVNEVSEYQEEIETIKLEPVDQEEFESQLPKFDTENSADFVRCIGQPKALMQHLETQPEVNEKEIVIVTGLPRSGTSMMMQMLTAGGLEPYIDDTRKADQSNPKGYYESEKVKKLAYQNNFISSCEGKVVKIVAPLISYLPQNLKYKIVLMNRDVDEIVRSQNAMLEALNRTGGNITDEKFKQIFLGQLVSFRQLMRLNNISYCEISYRDAVANPADTIAKVNEFLGMGLNAESMAEAIDPSLYRQKGKS